MGKIKDITGQKFGRLTAIKFSGRKSKNNKAIWICKCDCGNIAEIVLTSLTTGNTKSCGCLHRETSIENGKKGLEDMAGKRFGKLTVIELSLQKTKNNRSLWLCKCDCGGEKMAMTSDLKSGKIRSCGCYLKEWKYERGSLNKFKIVDEQVFVYTRKGEYVCKCDIGDYDVVCQYTWHNSTGYANAHVCQNGINKRITMTRLFLNPKDSEQVDHINHDTTDNRRKNLRICTVSQNSMNSKLYSANTSGYTGVYFNKSRNKWGAYIHIDGKMKNIGSFEKYEDACVVREKAELKYYGEFSRLLNQV